MEKTLSAVHKTRIKIHITGIVQGVGFRPFIYRLAKKLGLNGIVYNDGAGVWIEVEGINTQEFIQRLQKEAPPRAKIEKFKIETLPPKNFLDFVILESSNQNKAPTLLSPDIATCDDCLRELFDSKDRRHLYPFINCTNCGPRYSIIKAAPYDRPNTTMAGFIMCRECEAEYGDPLNRRFHAQPNACQKCGPRAWLVDNKSDSLIDGHAAIERAKELIKEGAILAIKGLGGFHFACDAINNAAVLKLREKKRGSQKPFAIMCPDIESVKKLCRIQVDEADFLISHTRPIVLMQKNNSDLLSKHVAPQTRSYGVFLPYTPLHHLICQGFTALVMTSANFSEEPMATTNEEAMKKLGRIADYFLMHNRDIYMRVDDSIIKKTGAKKTMLLRRGRGHAPGAIDLGEDFENTPTVFAAGALLKNTFALTDGRYAVLSQHIGDLENERALGCFNEALVNIKRSLDLKPIVVAMDMHPDYQSTRMAREYANKNNILPERRIRVQHHHAHAASVMAEHGLKGPVIGVVLDGTGLGTDATIWGGEILVATLSDFKRTAHFKAVPLPGADAAAREPWRMAISYLSEAYGKSLYDAIPDAMLEKVGRAKIETIVKMIEQRINSPLTSSAGRLFDAVSALLGLNHTATYEAEAAIALETAAMDFMEKNFAAPLPYDFQLIEAADPIVIDFIPTIKGIIDDMRAGTEPGRIAARFHLTLSTALSSVVKRVSEKTGIHTVVLSGGVFQNTLLLDETVKTLETNGFTVYHNERVPANDGGIALGQALIASFKSRSFNEIK